jgi:predicted MPP superfamily phosphohydrolase
MGAARTLGGAVLATGVVGAACLGYALAEAQAFVLRRRTVPVLPPGSEPIRVLHLSDLHLTPNQQRKAEWVRHIGALEPDLVISTGDHIAHPDAVPVLLDALDPLLDRPGLFVFGSNDYTGPVIKNPLNYFRGANAPRTEGTELPSEDLRDGLAAAGWTDLNNSRTVLEVNGTVVDAAGVDDPHIRRDRYDEVAGRRHSESGLNLGVTHAPYLRVLDAMVRDQAHLILAGHTHGGQVCVPGYGALVTNCDLDRARASGLSTHPSQADPVAGDGAWLHVSAGVGTSPYTPIRVACRPEAIELTLVPRQ